MAITGYRLALASGMATAALTAGAWTVLAQERRGPACVAADPAPQPGFGLATRQPAPACIRIRLR
jgi:hypothetical protein